MPLEELVWQLMLDTGFYIAMGAMPAGSQRQANLRALVDKALAYRESQGGSLYGFMQYIEAVKQRKVSMGQVKTVAEEDDTIRIMTIHKSKGLEFPMVLIAGYCKRLNYTKASKDIAIHKDVGIGFPLVNYEQSTFKTGIIQNVIRAKLRQEETEEEKRILYVAMTRAKDILYLLGITERRDEAIQDILSSLASNSSYFGMSGKAIYEDPKTSELVENEDLKKLSQGVKRNARRALELLDADAESGLCDAAEANAFTTEEIARRMSFTYPYCEDLKIKSKYAVSELNRRESGELYERQRVQTGADGAYSTESSERSADISLTEPQSFKLHKEFTAAQLGTITHKVLEKLNFAAALGGGDAASREKVLDYIKLLMQSMVCDEFLTEEEIAAVDAEKLVGFVLSPLGRRMAAAQRGRKNGRTGLVREKPFNLVCEVGGAQSIVQGIIDCFFEEEDGGLVLVDYKTTAIKSADELAVRRPTLIRRYRTQIDLYRRALTAASGKPVKEAYLYLTDIGETIEM